MKIKTILLTIVLAVLFVAVLPRQAEARVTFSYFYDSLQPFGDWVDVDTYGYCWQPRGMDADWRPYTDGYWSYTDAGWTWVSYEDFGSITYHYGRWIRLEDFGWVWKPDYEWGPAWVSWRQSDDYIGWAPLPPDAVFEPEAGIGVWVDRDYDIGPSAYAFCEYRYFGAPVLRNFLVPRHRNFAIINSTVNITNITVLAGDGQRRMVFNGGPDYRRISERTEHRIEMLQLVRQTEGDWAQQHRSELSRKVGNQLIVNAPEVEVSATRFAPTKVAQQIHTPKIDKGWAGVSDPAEKQRIKQRYQDQTRGLTRTTAPATAVSAVQVQSMMNATRANPPRPAAQTPQTPQTPQAAQVPQPQQPTGGKTGPDRSGPRPAAEVEQPQHGQHGQHGQPTPQVQQPEQVQPQTHQPQRPQQAQPSQVQQPQHAQPQVQQPQTLQPKIQQEQLAEQQRKAADAQARATRDQQEQAAQRAQQAQQQAEHQRKAADAQARAARDQQEQAQRAQQEAQRRQPEQPARQLQPQAQQSPSPDAGDHKKKHNNDNNN